MTAPPGLAPSTTLSGERITAGTAPDLSTRNGQRRYLCGELGIDQRQARLLIAAYERDQAAPLPASAQKSYRLGFLDWLMRRAPGPGRQRPVARQGRDYRPRDDAGHLVTATS